MCKEIEIHKNMTTGKIEIKDVCIYVERDSICMGDDVTAPHGEKFFFKKSDKLSDLLNILMNNYLYNLHINRKWEINANNKILGYIEYSKEESAFKYKLAIPDDYILNLNIKSIYCNLLNY